MQTIVIYHRKKDPTLEQCVTLDDFFTRSIRQVRYCSKKIRELVSNELPFPKTYNDKGKGQVVMVSRAKRNAERNVPMQAEAKPDPKKMVQ